MSIEDIIESLRLEDNCEILPPSGQPVLTEGQVLPKDIQRFYALCGGLKLYCNSAYSLDISPPGLFVLASPEIIGEMLGDGDLSNEWYIIGRGDNKQFVVIDMSVEKFGNCYDAYWDRYANPGDNPIISLTFCEFLRRMVENHGDYWYWLKDTFVGYGDAYD